MSDSDTFLDSILEGVIVTDAPVPAQERGLLPDQQVHIEADAVPTSPQAPERPETSDKSTPALTGLDALLEGLPPMSAPNGPTTPASGSPSNVAEDLLPEVIQDRSEDVGSAPQSNGSTVEPDLADTEPPEEPVTPYVALPVAAPHEILGLPGQLDIGASHIELALEINGLAASAPRAEAAASRAAAPTETRDEAAIETRPEAATSFAAIAREIAATVDVKSPTAGASHAGTDQTESDHSTMYLRTRGHRRRRVKHSTRVTVTQVLAIVLLLVVGLGAEYEYVAKGHAGSTASAPIVAKLPTTHVPTVRLTPTKGSLFRFATSGSARSASFRVAAPFSLVVSARCSPVTKSSSVDAVLQARGQQAANIFLPVRAAGSHGSRSATLRPGTYLLVVHVSGICSWSAQGIARP